MPPAVEVQSPDHQTTREVPPRRFMVVTISSNNLPSHSVLLSETQALVFVAVQSLCRVQLCDPMDRSMPGFPVLHYLQSLLKFMSIESEVLSNHFVLCHPLLLPPSIFPSIRVFSNESVLRIRWSKYWSFSFSISPSNEYSGLIPLGWTG